jgi:hypothetical protein
MGSQIREILEKGSLIPKSPNPSTSKEKAGSLPHPSQLLLTWPEGQMHLGGALVLRKRGAVGPVCRRKSQWACAAGRR